MAAVSTAPIPNGNHTSEKDASSDHGPSGFTAVNGRDPVSNGGDSKNASPRSSDSTIKVGGDYRGHRPTTYPSARQPTPPSRPGESVHDMANGMPKEPPIPRSHESSPGAYKRKRSQSDDGEVSTSSNSQYNLSPSGSNEQGPQEIQRDRYYGPGPVDAATRHATRDDDNDRGDQAQYPHDSNATNGHNNPHPNPWHDRGHPFPPNYQPNGHRLDQSDTQLAEALQRENHGQETPHRPWGVPTRSEGDSGDGENYGRYSQDGTPSGSGQNGPKRKRVFSNRTKTGCLTCRRRKKKCDEQHPHCNNCIRGGFQCEGYNSRSTWQKPSNIKTPIPLQSKDGFPDIGDQGYHGISPRQGRSSLNRPVEGLQTRPIVVDDSEHPHHAQLTASPTSAGPRSRGSYPGQPWPNPGNPSYLSERGPQPKQDYLPSFSEIARENSNKPEYRAMPPMRDMQHPMHNVSQPPPNPAPPAPTGQYTAYPPPQADYRQQQYQYPHQAAPPPPPQPHGDPNNFQNTARMALSSIEQAQPAMRSSTADKSERTKMLENLPFKISDPTLVADRARCKAALSRYNNERTEPPDDLTFQLLRRVFEPPENLPYRDKPIGSLGADTVVEPQFKCHYGYNIKLGDKVTIGANCTIVDASTVTIGSQTTIGDNVTIVAGAVGKGILDRQGATGIWQGRPVTIGKECDIGAGSFIYPGVTLGEGCTIKLGSHVQTDVPKGQTWGQPAADRFQEDPLAGSSLHRQ